MLVTHSTQHRVHEVVHDVWLYQILAFKNAHDQIGYDRKMLFETFTNNLAV